MTKEHFKIIDKEFISYYGGYGHLISNGDCKFWLWHDESGSQKVCDKLNIIMEENEQLKKEKEELKDGLQEFREYCNYLKSILEDNEIWYE